MIEPCHSHCLLTGTEKHISVSGALNGVLCLVNSCKALVRDTVLKFYKQQAVSLQHFPKPTKEALTDLQGVYYCALGKAISILTLPRLWLPLLLMGNIGVTFRD